MLLAFCCVSGYSTYRRRPRPLVYAYITCLDIRNHFLTSVREKRTCLCCDASSAEVYMKPILFYCCVYLVLLILCFVFCNFINFINFRILILLIIIAANSISGSTVRSNDTTFVD